MKMAKSKHAFACAAIRITVAVLSAGSLAVSTSAQPLRPQLTRTKHGRGRLKIGAVKNRVSATGMVVTTGLSATSLASTLAGTGVTISGTPTLQGAAEQAGTFTNAPAIVGFSSGIILSSGNAGDAAFDYEGEDLPDTDEDGPGYDPLNALINNQATNDAAVLQFSFIPTSSTIYFKYVFASAEYPNYVGQYNDPMALFVNGTNPGNNVAILPTTPPVAVTINNVNVSANAAYFNKYNGAGDLLPFGGETKALTAIAQVNAGQVNTITLAVADALDDALDSAVFIQASSLSTTPPPAPPPTTQAAPALSPIPFALLGIILLASGAIFVRHSRTSNARQAR